MNPYQEPIPEISVETVGTYLQQPTQEVQLIDVREPQEVQMANIPEFTVLPLSQFEQWSGAIHDQLDSEKETWVMCHHGMRSAQMCQWLRSQGFTNVKNIKGGIDAYSQQVDSSVPLY
ncbi:rhodanese-like domain-containing protein [Spirulina sp. CS-785/01]|uniref:rhodanese-like domain-containing protein n=1 Tax=Spirulina sp. CS-785/01 TaxID=3021716 RepID=UPI00233067B4|nr:rhodanese-like domain-containing protein [Spirulina sp. CS-785/01]MDB9314465.1 rhodanese-like domain-containing protein [Spirulina sp. CS-785/01]